MFMNTKCTLTVVGGCGAWRVVVMERVMVSAVDGGEDAGDADGCWIGGVMTMRSWYSGVGWWWHGGEEVRLWLWVRQKSRRKMGAVLKNIRERERNPAAQMNFTSTNDPTTEEFREQNRNPSSSKRVHFVNSVIILNKEDEAKEEGNVKTITTEHEDHKMTVKSKEEFEEETKDEIKEE
nr:hypothetical protein [Tanacetum cinerariifolium]